MSWLTQTCRHRGQHQTTIWHSNTHHAANENLKATRRPNTSDEQAVAAIYVFGDT